MNLTFTNNSSEFRAESHFNLHLENAGRAKLYKRTSGTGWDYMTDLTNIFGTVIDIDVAVNIPKEYRVECAATPTMAVTTSCRTRQE